MIDPAARTIQRLAKEIAHVEQAGVKPLELSAHHVTVHAVVGSSLRHSDVECLSFQAERNVFVNASSQASANPGVRAVALKTARNPLSLFKKYLLDKNPARLVSKHEAATASMLHPELDSLLTGSTHVSEPTVWDLLQQPHAWCRSCTVSAVESAFFNAISTPSRLVDLRSARQALERSAANPSPKLVTDCYRAAESMSSVRVESGLAGRAKEVEREILAAKALIQQTSYVVLDELERRAFYEYLSSTSATFLSSSVPFDEKVPEASLPLQTLSSLWSAFCKAGVEGRSPRAAFLEMTESLSVARHMSAAVAEQLLVLWEEAVLERTKTPPANWVVVSHTDRSIYSSSSTVQTYVAITSGRADVIVVAVGPYTASRLRMDGAATILGEIPVAQAQQVAAMTQSLIQNGGVLEDPLEAFKAAAALSAPVG